MNIKQMLEKTAREVPQKDAIVLGSYRITYGELNEASNRIANALIKLGVEKGDHVAILMPSGSEWAVNYFGVVKAGGISILLSSMLKAPELVFLLRDSDSTILITKKDFSEMLSSVLPSIPLLKHVFEIDGDYYKRIVTSSPSTSPAIDMRDDDETAIIYTSGVLGKQKGVVHTHASLTGTPPIISSGIQRRREDVIIGLAPFFYLFGLCHILFGSIMKGCTIIVVPDFTPRAVLKVVERERGTTIFGVPAMYNALATLRDETIKRYDLGSLRVAVTSGAKSSPHFMELLENKFHLTLCEVYGLTELEAVSVSTVDKRKLGTVGKPICDLKIIEDNGKEVSQGKAGEALFKVPWAMRGYYKAPDLTAQVLKDGWFHTGDLVRMDEDGYLEYMEKKSFIIVTASGLKISPWEVEDVLLTHPCVAEVAYVGVNDEYGGQIPTAFIVPKEGHDVSVEEITYFCSESLADFKLPKQIKFVASIPKTGSGKIYRQRLKESR
jgi:long-chain acyl-CoA synthetase